MNFILTLVALILFWNVASWVHDMAVPYVTDYYLVCKELGEDVHNCPTGRIARKARYRPFPEQQMVVTEGYFAEKYDCTVFDKYNWRCKSEPDRTFQCMDGIFYDSTNMRMQDGETKVFAASVYWHIYAFYRVKELLSNF